VPPEVTNSNFLILGVDFQHVKCFISIEDHAMDGFVDFVESSPNQIRIQLRELDPVLGFVVVVLFSADGDETAAFEHFNLWTI